MKAEERARRAFEDIVAVDTDPRHCLMHAERAIARHIRAAEQDAERATIERCAKLCVECLEKALAIVRRAGYGGRWEGYGRWIDDKTGTECAVEIRALPSAYEEGA